LCASAKGLFTEMFGFVLFNVRFGLKVKLSALKTIVRASNLDKMVIPFSVISEQMTLKCR